MEKSGSEPHERITRESVEEAEEQIEVSYIKIMDDWEASVPDNGQFFIKVGRKVMAKDPASYVDTRALILKEGRPTQSLLDRELNAAIAGDDETSQEAMEALGVPDDLRQKLSVTPQSPKQYIAMTRKGPKIMTLTGNDFEKLSRLGIDEKGGFSDSGRTISYGESASHYTDLTDDDAGDKFHNEALTKSIQISRELSENAKNKRALDAAKQEQARAQRLSELSNKSIKPPTGEGPTAPPSSPKA